MLNWGLGHATRCIPIIRAIKNQGHTPVIASDGRALMLLQKEFPELESIALPAYNVKYFGKSFALTLAVQMPKIAYKVIAEHFAIRKIVKKHKIDMIISDNRFGCFHPKLKCIFISHQLHLKSDLKSAAKSANTINHFWIRKYDEVWIPDVAEDPNLSGSLSHPSPFPNTKYLGVLSRMKKMDVPMKYKLCIIISGPEPQRTYLEKILMEQAQQIDGKVLFVKGKTEKKEVEQIGNITAVSYLTSADLNEAICASEVILSRSGYSTLMDLTALGKTAIVIPTPGQTEQVYLAEHFHKQGVFLMQDQKEVDLLKAMKEIKNYKGLDIDGSFNEVIQ